MIIFTINNEVLFIPSDKKLVSLNDPQIYVVLTAPASRCLLLLIENSPEIVAHKHFLDEVWGKEGMIIPLNTLYQNISMLRRGLKKTGGGDSQIIKTISKQGFVIGAEITVAKNHIDDNGISFKEKETMGAEQKKGILIKLSRFYLRYFLYGMCVLIFLIVPLMKWWSNNNQRYFFNNYSEYANDESCHIFTNASDEFDKNETKKIQRRILLTGFDCKTYPWVYVSVFKASSVSSAILCKEIFGSKITDNCISLYFRD